MARVGFPFHIQRDGKIDFLAPRRAKSAAAGPAMRTRSTAKIYAQSVAEEPHGPRPLASLGLPRGYCAGNEHARAGKQGAAFGAADKILLRMLENVDISRRKNLVR